MSITGKLALFGGTKKVPQNSIPIDRAAVTIEGLNAVSESLLTGKWSMFTSPEVPLFEGEFSQFVGSEHTVLVNSCTTAILASLHVLGISSGDLVGAPAYTYVGTCLPILELGAKPVWIDISSNSQNLDPNSLRIKLDEQNLSAVVLPLLFGDERNALECAELCLARGVPVVFDCAQFLGNKEITSKLSEMGLCCFSFGESKILRLGEGGAICTNSRGLSEALMRYRHEGESWLGKDDSRVSLSEVSPLDVLRSLASTHRGLNFRPLGYTAALGRVQIRDLDGVLKATQKNALLMKELLAPIKAISLPHDRSVWWTFPFTINTPNLSRDVLMAALLAEGIPVGVHFPRLMPHHPIFEIKELGEPDYPNANLFSLSHLVLPIYSRLGDADIHKMAEVILYVLSEPSLYDKESLLISLKFLEKSKLTELSSGLYMFLAE